MTQGAERGAGAGVESSAWEESRRRSPGIRGGELATHLTGRHHPIPLLPFSFAEFLSARGPEERTAVEYTALCRLHAEIGGFPEVVLKPIDGGGYLRTLLAAVIHKDIVSRFRLRAPQALDAVAA
jgi:predicted AAA+ superfamily ATPase